MHPTEGFLSLFKGSFTQWVYDMLHLLLQPTLEVVLNEALGVYDNVPLSTYIDASAPSALSVVASNLIVGWLLSPLELVRTRLMVQSASPIHRKYNGTYHALKTIVREEGGLSSLYFSSYHLAPTLLKHTLDPVFRHMGLFALDRGAGIDPYDHPTTFAFGSLVWKTMAATIMLPIDTIRTRLQAQPRYSKKPTAGAAHLDFRTCVPLSPVPYTGMANCAWRIVTEEGESLKTMTKRRAVANAGDKGQQVSSAVGHYGLRGLYPGFTLQLAANVAIFGLGFFSANETEFI
ncbi:mitochondrial carrier domain-containing protein [Coemansia spiralis]|nr:mitochondrial carrier domain-containing protein [Coemansia spiralis]